MKKLLTTLIISLFASVTFSQNTIGMTFGRYFNYGAGMSFKDFKVQYPTFSVMDTASQLNSAFNSNYMYTTTLVGATYFWSGKDSTKNGGYWKKSAGIFLGKIRIGEFGGFNETITNTNYLHINSVNGIIDSSIVDSLYLQTYSCEGVGNFRQAHFGLHRIIPTESRVKGLLGMNLRLGYAKMNFTLTGKETQAYVLDSSEVFAFHPFTEKNTSYALSSKYSFMGQLELSGGLMIPLAKNDDKWWISFTGNVGYGGILFAKEWKSRITFFPEVGLHFSLKEKKLN